MLSNHVCPAQQTLTAGQAAAGPLPVGALLQLLLQVVCMQETVALAAAAPKAWASLASAHLPEAPSAPEGLAVCAEHRSSPSAPPAKGSNQDSSRGPGQHQESPQRAHPTGCF